MDNQEDIRCDSCNHLFKTTKALRAHVKKNNCTREGKVQCDQCGGYFAVRTLKVHKTKTCPKRNTQPTEMEVLQEELRELRNEMEYFRNHSQWAMEEIRGLKEKVQEETNSITLSEKTERTIRLPKNARFTAAQAINLMKINGAIPSGAVGGHEIDGFIVDKLVETVNFPQPTDLRHEKVDKTAKVLQEATKQMMRQHPECRNMLMAGDLPHRMVYLFVSLSEEGGSNFGTTQSEKLSDAIKRSFTLSVEAITAYLTKEMGEEWTKVAQTLKDTFEKHRADICSKSMGDFERMLLDLYTEVDARLAETDFWARENKMLRKRTEKDSADKPRL